MAVEVVYGSVGGSRAAVCIGWNRRLSTFGQLFCQTMMDQIADPHSTNAVISITNINNTVNVSKVIADENPETTQWISPSDPRRRHQDVGTDRLDGVVSLLLETD
ncbi:hypothetical protein HOY80DRAFT_999024 [Tuber brumale]|nr:hypothetical protein HOY80DRAFT_999024 [Tuber brumale]